MSRLFRNQTTFSKIVRSTPNSLMLQPPKIPISTGATGSTGPAGSPAGATGP